MLICFLGVLILAAGAAAQKGTTPNIQSILLNRCLTFQREINNIKLLASFNDECLFVILEEWEYMNSPLPCPNSNDGIDCNVAVSLFLNSVRGKDPCSFVAETYQPFLDYVLKETPRDRVTFWSGLHDRIQYYSSKLNLVALESGTLAGYMLDGLNWCGSTAGGLNYDFCPGWDMCFPNHVQATYWKAASTRFAQLASGYVNILINAANHPAIRDLSFLKTVELPNMNPSKIKSLNMILVSLDDTETSLGCERRPSISGFAMLAKQRGLNFICVGPITVSTLVKDLLPTFDHARKKSYEKRNRKGRF